MSNWKPEYDSSRKYNLEWEEEFSWLGRNANGEPECKICVITILPKLDNIKKHESSQRHIRKRPLSQSTICVETKSHSQNWEEVKHLKIQGEISEQTGNEEVLVPVSSIAKPLSIQLTMKSEIAAFHAKRERDATELGSNCEEVSIKLDNSDQNCENSPIIIEEEKATCTPKANWLKYERYNISWESDDRLAGWISPNPTDPRKVNCKYCSCVLRAHKADLYKHSETQKHQKRACDSVIWGGDQISNPKKKISIISKPKKLKTETIVAADGTSIIIQSAHGVLGPKKEANFFVDYSDTEPMVEIIESESTQSDSEQEINDIVNRMGCILIADIVKILQTQKNVLKFFKDNGNPTSSEANLRKMAKICVGHLSQKYLVESALESSRVNTSMSREKTDLASNFQTIEQKLETTLDEMKNLKNCFEDISHVFPFTPIHLGDFVSQPSSGQHD